MLRDVFYYGSKPNVHPREQFAENLADARLKATTHDFWIINEFGDYRNFDWDFDFELLPDEDVWAEEHNNVWPSQHQKDSGTWLCPKEHSDIIIYRGDVDPVMRKNERTSNWVLLDNIDDTKFDFSWHPDPTDPPYIYKWGCKFFPSELAHVLEYHVAGATNEKYMNTIAELLPNNDCWVEHDLIDKTKFDMSWRPDPREPAFIYVWGNKHISGELKPTIEYHVPGATERKYMTEPVEILPLNENWNIIQATENFDYTWRPDPREPDYIYVWGNKYIPAELRATVEYHCPGATERKYMGEADVAPEWERYSMLLDVAKTGFDFSWRPDPREPAFIYVWGNQWNDATIEPTLEYHAPGATERKYMTDVIARIKPAPADDRWSILVPVDSFDYSWRPNPTSPPYIYVFGNTQYSAEEMPTIQYVEQGAESLKYINTVKAKLAPNMANWNVPKNIDTSSFDFSWVPHPKSPPYIYEFATIWNDRGGPSYVVPGATEHFYVEDVKAKTLTSGINWEVPQNIDVRKFDFSWIPHPLAPSYIYQFGTKLDNTDGPRYITPNNNGEIVYLERVEFENDSGITVSRYYIETTLEDLVKAHPGEIFWALRKNIDYSTFDFNWLPETVEIAYELNYVHVFGSVDSELTQTYFVSADNYLAGENSFKFVETVELTDETLAQMFVKPDMFYVDRSNPESAARFETLRAKFGTRIQKTRYLNSWVDTINRCVTKSQTTLFWVINSELDYSEFEFAFYPSPWQEKMVHVFGTQWSHWGNTYLINGETFKEDTKYIKIIEHLSNLNFVKSVKATAANCVYDVVVIDHGNKETTNIRNQIESKINGCNITVVNYDNSYLNTIRNVLGTLPMKKEHYVWICSSVCDYSNFDFTYICDPFTRENLHVFPSGKQKFGDTFLIDVNKTRELINEITELGEYDQVNYNQTMRVNRLEAPKLITEHDTLVDAIKNSILDIDFPYATLMTVDNTDLEETEYEPLNLWSNDTKNIIITTTGATRVVIPKQAKDYIDYELYDYPYIKRAPKLVKSNPLDIVFLSNGETGAEENYEHLLKVTENLPNRVVRVDGVNGRAAAYHAAAEASNTPWFFTVFAKLEVSPKFDWSWQPDRMQIPKHYIFHAKNPVNGLIYGHQAMIAYNKKLTLGNEGKGLDFTLDNHHEVVPLISGTARYNTDSFSTWRTAFREAIKLKMGNDDDSRERLEAWLTKGEGEFAEYSIKGAQDAMTYYDEVNGDFDALKLSYEWVWLREKFDQS